MRAMCSPCWASSPATFSNHNQPTKAYMRNLSTHSFPDLRDAERLLDAALIPPADGASAAYNLLALRVIAFAGGTVRTLARPPVVTYRKRRTLHAA